MTKIIEIEVKGNIREDYFSHAKPSHCVLRSSGMRKGQRGDYHPLEPSQFLFL